MRHVAEIHCASLVAAKGLNSNVGDCKLSSGMESVNVGVSVVAERNARVTFTSQSAVSTGGFENDWPSLNMSIEVSSMNTECPPPDATEFEVGGVNVAKYAGL